MRAANVILSAASGLFTAIETIRDLRFGRSIVEETSEILDRAEKATDAAILMYNEEHVRRIELERKLASMVGDESKSGEASTEELVKLGWDAFKRARRETAALPYEESKDAIDAAIVEAVAARVREERPIYRDLLNRLLYLDLSLLLRPCSEESDRWNILVTRDATGDGEAVANITTGKAYVHHELQQVVAKYEAEDRTASVKECGPTSPVRVA